MKCEGTEQEAWEGRKFLSGYIKVLSCIVSRSGVSRVPTGDARSPFAWLATITFLVCLRSQDPQRCEAE